MTTKCATQKPHRKVPQFKSRNTTVWIILGLGHYLSEIIDLFFVAFFHKWRHAQLFIIFIYIDIFVIHYYIWHKCKVIPSEEISDPVVFVFNFRCSKSWTYAAIFGLYNTLKYLVIFGFLVYRPNECVILSTQFVVL